VFNPAKDDVRRFFCEAWAKHRQSLPLTPLESIALDWMLEHPEYHDDLASLQHALVAEYPPEGGRTNPFLHLSMHLAVSEQVSIDQPPGIRDAYARLAARMGSLHEAAHAIIDCLGEVVWAAQRDRTLPDSARYLDCVLRRAGR
jgi:hypothetical protein